MCSREDVCFLCSPRSLFNIHKIIVFSSLASTAPFLFTVKRSVEHNKRDTKAYIIFGDLSAMSGSFYSPRKQCVVISVSSEEHVGSGVNFCRRIRLVSGGVRRKLLKFGAKNENLVDFFGYDESSIERRLTHLARAHTQASRKPKRKTSDTTHGWINDESAAAGRRIGCIVSGAAVWVERCDEERKKNSYSKVNNREKMACARVACESSRLRPSRTVCIRKARPTARVAIATRVTAGTSPRSPTDVLMTTTSITSMSFLREEKKQQRHEKQRHPTPLRNNIVTPRRNDSERTSTSHVTDEEEEEEEGVDMLERLTGDADVSSPEGSTSSQRDYEKAEESGNGIEKAEENDVGDEKADGVMGFLQLRWQTLPPRLRGLIMLNLLMVSL